MKPIKSLAISLLPDLRSILFQFFSFSLLVIASFSYANTTPTTDSNSPLIGEGSVTLQNPIVGPKDLFLRMMFWKAPCTEPLPNESLSCGIPEPIPGLEDVFFTLKIAPVFEKNQAARTEFLIKKNGFDVKFSVYSIAPNDSSPYPPYVQIQAELIHPLRSLCMQSIRWKTDFEMPSFICGSFANQPQPHKIGISVLQIQSLPDSSSVTGQ